MEKEITRSDFLKGAGLTVAGLAAAGLISGCSPKVSSEAQNNDEESQEIVATEIGVETDFSLDEAKYDVDVVIVGSGTAGVSAVVEAADQGIKALLVEVAAGLGGASNFAEGLLGVNTKYQEVQGRSYDMDALAWSDYEFSSYLANYGLVKDFVYASNGCIEWLEGKGVKFIQPNPINPNNEFQHFYDGQGKALVKVLAEQARQNGVDILMSTRAKRLCMQDGAVAGLIVEDGTGEFLIKTKSVILGSGGILHNEEIWNLKYPYPKHRIVINSSEYSRGDGYLMAHAVGGDPSGICSIGWVWAGLKSFGLHSELSTAACNEPYFWVNEEGKRFIPESLLIRHSQIANAILSQRRVFSILTQQEVDRLMTEGCTVGWGSYIFAGSKLEDLQNQLDTAVDESPEGFFWADSIDDLAQKLSVDAATLKATMENYRSMVEAGTDTEFNKPPQYLHEFPLDGRFYAFELLADATNAKGGIVINREFEVINTDAKPIPGLYATGLDCSGYTAFTYYSQLGGSTQTFCVHSGRTSAANAAKRAKA